jgi:hypothetical protein
MASFDEIAEAVGRAFDQACQAASAREEWAGVYLSPLWEVETAGDAANVRAWKRSVLRRVPGAGAEPWGHAFLIVNGTGGGIPRVSEETLGRALGSASGPAVPLLPILWEGPPSVHLLFRPRTADTEERLRRFLGAVRSEFSPPLAVARRPL